MLDDGGQYAEGGGQMAVGSDEKTGRRDSV